MELRARDQYGRQRGRRCRRVKAAAAGAGALISHQMSRLDVPPPPRTRAFRFGQKKSFDSIRFDFRYRIDFFRIDSIRQSDKFAACTLIFK